MAEIILVRHGKTAGNLEGRYIGSRTDEPLCEEGIHALEEKVREGTYPPVDLVYASPMIRCRQTAKILCRVSGVDRQQRNLAVSRRRVQ